MNCSENNRTELIEKYLLKELSDSEMKAFEEHFLGCDECFEELQTMSQFTELIKGEGNDLFNEYIFQPERDSPSNIIGTLKEFFFPGWSLKPALTYAFMAVFSGLIVISIFNNRGTGIVDNSPQIERLAELQKMYPAMFSEAHDLENLVSQQYRSEVAVAVTIPENGKIFSGDVEFKWKTNSKEKLQLKILDNNEKVVAEIDNPAYEFTFKPGKYEISSGLYYWKLETPGDLLYVGKFYLDLK